MNQMTEYFNECNRIMRELRDNPKTFNMEQIAFRLKVLDAVMRGVNANIAMAGIALKDKRATKHMKDINLIGNTSAIDLMLGDPEVDKVKCPEHDDLITRAQCLDESESTKYFDRCAGCDIGAETKRMLLPDKSNGVA